MIGEDGVNRLDCGLCIALVDDDGEQRITVYTGGLWTTHGVSRFTPDEAVEVSEGIIELLNWVRDEE